MNDRLTDLLTDEAHRLDVPPPPASAVLVQGRRLRRRRRAATGAVALATVAVLGGGALAASAFLPRADDPAPGPDLVAAADVPLGTWAAASGSTVQLDDGRTVDVEGTVKSLYYTSAGVLARTGATASTDEATSSYALIGEDGAVGSFALELGDRVPGTDPTLPYLAYATRTDDPERWEVVLRDVRTGDEVRRIPVDGAFTWGGWVAPPVALSGDHVYVAMDDATLDVAWRTGEVTRSAVLRDSSFPDVAAGRAVLETGQRLGADGQPTGVPGYRVVDAQTGEVLRADRLRGAAGLVLAPDGRHALLLPWRTCADDGSCTFDRPASQVIDLDTGDEVSVDLGDGVGWTPAGDLLRIDADSVDVCDPDTGACTSSPVEVGAGDLRLGGSSYES